MGKSGRGFVACVCADRQSVVSPRLMFQFFLYLSSSMRQDIHLLLPDACQIRTRCLKFVVCSCSINILTAATFSQQPDQVAPRVVPKMIKRIYRQFRDAL